MLIFKSLLFTTVVVTMGTAVISGSLPYFPIEISKCAASTTQSLWIFRIGSILSSLVLWYEKGFWEHAVACIGFIILAWFDDTNHPNAHMAGVLVMLLGSIPIVPWRVQLCAMLVFIIRIPMKILMVISWENARDPLMIYTQVRSIMSIGADENVLSVFRVTGAMQWISFYLLMNTQ